MSWFTVSKEMIEVMTPKWDIDSFLQDPTTYLVKEKGKEDISEKWPGKLKPGDMVWYPDGQIATVHLHEGKFYLKMLRTIELPNF